MTDTPPEIPTSELEERESPPAPPRRRALEGLEIPPGARTLRNLRDRKRVIE